MTCQEVEVETEADEVKCGESSDDDEDDAKIRRNIICHFFWPTTLNTYNTIN